MISFIIPAYNEEALLGQTLATLNESARALGEPFEVVVVDDASTDRTPQIAREHGARLVQVKARQIAAARNAGARAAQGEVLVFVDADTLVPPEVLRGVRRALDAGAIGGGARVTLEGVPFFGRAAVGMFTFCYFHLGFAAGCFIFARRDAFEKAGRFDEQYFASEEVHLSRALRGLGRFALIPDRVVSSGRKARMYSVFHILRLLLRVLIGGTNQLRRREGLELWYGGKREEAPPRADFKAE
jgi:glycosyltransferase involved in cell wall biosynthesis